MMKTTIWGSLVFVACLLGPSRATPVEAAEVPAACRAKIDARLPGWQLTVPSADVAAWAKQEEFDPTIVLADLDDDGQRDTAVLLIAGTGAARRVQIAVCMSRKAGPELHIIPDLYCSDGISLTKKGSEGFDFETDKTIRYRTDGIHAFCFEKAGATYLYRGGRFIRIVDSD